MDKIDPKNLIVYIANKSEPTMAAGFFDHTNCGDCASIEEMVDKGLHVRFPTRGYIPLAWSEEGHVIRSNWVKSYEEMVKKGQIIEHVGGVYKVKRDLNLAMIQRDGPAKVKETPKAIVEEKDLTPAFFGNLMKEASMGHQISPAFGSSQ